MATADTIIEGLKQGNALELQLVKQLQEGLKVIASGMEKECHDRSDALDEPREQVQQRPAVDIKEFNIAFASLCEELNTVYNRFDLLYDSSIAASSIHLNEELASINKLEAEGGTRRAFFERVVTSSSLIHNVHGASKASDYLTQIVLDEHKRGKAQLALDEAKEQAIRRNENTTGLLDNHRQECFEASERLKQHLQRICDAISRT